MNSSVSSPHSPLRSSRSLSRSFSADEKASTSKSPSGDKSDNKTFDVVKFSSGNPRVEQIYGNIHLFRELNELDDLNQIQTGNVDSAQVLTWSDRVRSDGTTAGSKSGRLKLPVRSFCGCKCDKTPGDNRRATLNIQNAPCFEMRDRVCRVCTVCTVVCRAPLNVHTMSTGACPIIRYPENMSY
jgi:hypothetical protein